jgi:hypothetical protein
MRWKGVFKKRSFWIWFICILISIVLASIVFVVRVNGSPSQPFVSVKFSVTNVFLYNARELRIQVTNRMFFNVSYFIEAEVLRSEPAEKSLGPLRSEKWERVEKSLGPFLVLAHSQKREAIMPPSEGVRVRVVFERQLKPIELSILKKFPGLKQHYPLQRRRSSPVYEWRNPDTDK